MNIKQFHHVAYRCKDAQETVEICRGVLNRDCLLAISEDEVPSTKEPDPYMHLFMDAGNGNILAFFEIPNSPPMGFDPNTPDWVQHIAMELETEEELMEAKTGVSVGTSTASARLSIVKPALPPGSSVRRPPRSCTFVAWSAN